MRYNLLELVQRILEALDSDEVNGIADTTEALAVANIVKESYYEIISEHGSKNRENLFHLDASTDNTRPCLMFVPSNVVNVHRLKYNVATDPEEINLRELHYLEPMAFLEMVNNFDVTQSWIGVSDIDFDGETFQIKYRNDVFPTYWTSPDDHIILLDAFNGTVENTDTAVRTYGYGLKTASFEMVDDFVPDLDPRQFSLLLNKAKAQAFVELKQTQNERVEKQERRLNALAYKTDDSTDPRPAIYRHKGYGRRYARLF
jgi:hypothetical protein